MDGMDLNNLSDDPQELQKVFEQLDAGVEPATPAPQEAEPPQEKQKQEQVEAAENNQAKQEEPQDGQEPQAQEAEPEGVLTKDGKHVIPYSVLKCERDRAARAEALTRELQERAAALEAQLAANNNQGAKTGESARTDEPQSVGDMTPEELESLKGDFPQVYKALMASFAAVRNVEGKLRPVEDRVRSVEVERERSAAEAVQEAIDAVPKLAHIQVSDAQAFELAKQFDAALRNQPAWTGKPLSERFAKVVEMVESAMGTIVLPGGDHNTPTASLKNADELAKEAKGRAAQAAQASKTVVPTSLSEFPAGQAPAQDEKEAAEQMTPQQLAEKFARMTPEQMDAYFQNL